MVSCIPLFLRVRKTIIHNISGFTMILTTFSQINYIVLVILDQFKIKREFKIEINRQEKIVCIMRCVGRGKREMTILSGNKIFS